MTFLIFVEMAIYALAAAIISSTLYCMFNHINVIGG
jgi:hypothetical protein